MVWLLLVKNEWMKLKQNCVFCCNSTALLHGRCIAHTSTWLCLLLHDYTAQLTLFSVSIWKACVESKNVSSSWEEVFSKFENMRCLCMHTYKSVRLFRALLFLAGAFHSRIVMGRQDSFSFPNAPKQCNTMPSAVSRAVLHVPVGFFKPVWSVPRLLENTPCEWTLNLIYS